MIDLKLTPFLAHPPELRKLMYTTNAIESLNARFVKLSVKEAISPLNKQL